MATYVDGARYDLLLLDIMMDELSGMESARARERCRDYFYHIQP